MTGQTIRVAAAVLVRGSEVLIARRKFGKLAGLWEFPGGKIEAGESAEACLVREIFEEFTVRIRVGGFLGRSALPDVQPAIDLVAYWAEHVSGEFALIDHDAIEWIAPSRLSEFALAPADLPFIPLIQKEMSPKAP